MNRYVLVMYSLTYNSVNHWYSYSMWPLNIHSMKIINVAKLDESDLHFLHTKISDSF